MLLYNEMNHLYVYKDSPPFSSLPVHPHPSTLGHHCKLLLQEKFRNTYNTAWIKSALCLCWWWWWGGLEMWPKGQEGICQGGCEQATFQGQNRMGKGTENYIFIECSDTKQQLKPSTAAKSLQSCPTLCDPHRRQPTRLPRPWDSPGKNTGVGCHFLLQCRKVKSESEVTQSCLTLHDPVDCSLPGSSIHGIFQARVLEWGAIAFSETKY